MEAKEGNVPYPLPEKGDGNTHGLHKELDLRGFENTHFYMSAQLDNTHIGRDVQWLVEEVISHITSVDVAQVEVLLEVKVKLPDGLSQQVMRTVSEKERMRG